MSQVPELRWAPGRYLGRMRTMFHQAAAEEAKQTLLSDEFVFLALALAGLLMLEMLLRWGGWPDEKTTQDETRDPDPVQTPGQ